MKDKLSMYNQMTFEQFYSRTMSSYIEDNKNQRVGQFLMNALAEYDIELYRSVPMDVDCFYKDSLLWNCSNWLQDNWVDTRKTVHDSSQ